MAIDDLADKGTQSEPVQLQDSTTEEFVEAARAVVEMKDKQNEVKLPDSSASFSVVEDCKAPEDKSASSPSEKQTDKASRRGFFRHIVAILALSSIVLANTNRQAFNQALVSMTKTKGSQNTPVYDEPLENTETPIATPNPPSSVDVTSSALAHEPPTTHDEQQLPQPLEIESTETTEGHAVPEGQVDEELEDTFDWNAHQIGTLQSAFHYGYTPFMIIGGRLSEMYGAKWVVFVSGFGSAICCMLAPLLADTDYRLLVASRVLMGMCQTGVTPSLYALLVRWLPPKEASIYLPMIKVGVMVGLMSGSLINSFLTWRMIFYTVGSISLLWCIMWSLLISSDPGDHSFLAQAELQHIQLKIKEARHGHAPTRSEVRKKSAPWLKILTNPVIISFMITKFTVKISENTQAMQIPMYLKDVFHMSKEMNSTLTSLNFAIQATFTGFVAWLAKEFISKKTFGLSKTGVRCLFQSIANFGMASGFMLLTLHKSLGVVTVSVLLLSVASMFGAGGEATLPVDLSLDYSASIVAIANSAANLSGVTLPSIVAFILGDQKESPKSWDRVWYTICAIVTTGGVVFVCGVKAEIQDFSAKGRRGKAEKKGEKQNEETDQVGADEFIAIEMMTKKENKLQVVRL